MKNPHIDIYLIMALVSLAIWISFELIAFYIIGVIFWIFFELIAYTDYLILKSRKKHTQVAAYKQYCNCGHSYHEHVDFDGICLVQGCECVEFKVGA